MSNFKKQLENSVSREWQHIKNGTFLEKIISEPVDPRLYQLMMEQI
ncbi:hypothetical protein HKJ32_05505 [Xylella fastidiosa subsp. multiplex]|nr:hypothetical protein [Xylella fastidiosa]MDD0870681.1 hypothetical protein [Xylella fastidiosa subsp. multiplex]QJP55922.1 hypothetical protein HKJ32_05505 [Xylella fastidiosa subsp. multiplex]